MCYNIEREGTIGFKGEVNVNESKNLMFSFSVIL